MIVVSIFRSFIETSILNLRRQTDLDFAKKRIISVQEALIERGVCIQHKFSGDIEAETYCHFSRDLVMRLSSISIPENQIIGVKTEDYEALLSAKLQAFADDISKSYLNSTYKSLLNINLESTSIKIGNYHFSLRASNTNNIFVIELDSAFGEFTMYLSVNKQPK